MKHYIRLLKDFEITKSFFIGKNTWHTQDIY